jgi:hypothetical protein
MDLGEACDHWATPRSSYRRLRAAILCWTLGHRWRIRLARDGGFKTNQWGQRVETYSPHEECARCEARRGAP